ncbi:MAG: hypothetical protein IKN27_06140 [Selenomonadaceae bacterium]|nr:hypothetical protein [Selenomonadaceae bacterium]
MFDLQRFADDIPQELAGISEDVARNIMAKAAYDSRNNSAPKFNVNPAPQFPRTDKVNGISGAGGGVTEAALAEMMKTVPWSKIPQEYKQILLQWKGDTNGFQI